MRSRLRSVARRLLRPSAIRRTDADAVWFADHYEMAPAQIHDFLGGSGVPLAGRTVADVGCGDGIMALGVTHRCRPASLVGFDVNAVDVATLLERCQRYGVARALPPELEFRQSDPVRLPSDDAVFDVVYTWSAFEHVGDPAVLLREIRRVMKPDGVFMLQLWPFYYSERGSHLWDWFPEPFHHLGETPDEIVAAMRASDRHSPEMTEYMAKEFRSLNRLTLDELHRAILAAGLELRKVEAIADATHVPPEAGRYPLSQLAISGVKLLAGPSSRHD
jgi:ubiquinone/menaquinone biosynthesis C-methylase UbiE